MVPERQTYEVFDLAMSAEDLLETLVGGLGGEIAAFKK